MGDDVGGQAGGQNTPDGKQPSTTRGSSYHSLMLGSTMLQRPQVLAAWGSGCGFTPQTCYIPWDNLHRKASTGSRSN